MSTDVEDQVRRYVETTLLAPPDEDTPIRGVSAHRYSAQGRARTILAAALVVFIAAFGTVALGARRSDTPAPQTGSTSVPMAPVSIVPGWTQIWEPGAANPKFDPSNIISGYIRGNYVADSSGNVEPQPAPLYDTPDGNIIGYLYPLAGVLDVDSYNAGTFNPAAARLTRWGCDPLDRSDLIAQQACDAHIHSTIGQN